MSPPLTNHWSAGKAYTDTTKSAIRWRYIALPTPLRACRPCFSMVGVTGSMGPFFCEFTLNGDLLPPQYPATYAHELAHFLGITSEAEANFYAYHTRAHIS